ncbi:MAG: GMC family oxidoreductase [Actinobacteria bacterium]|nr:GMC family oxidoreductase [Actinomycetota bacterium]
MEPVVDVLIVGAGPSGSVAAHTLASKGFSVLCLEQGEWINSGDMPGSKPEFELLTRSAWAWDPNERRMSSDYPLNNDDAEIHPIMFNAVGGGSIVYGGHWMRLLPSDFRVRSLDGVADDWPIAYEDVEPYYDEVDAYLGVSGLGGDPAQPDQEPPLPPLPLGPGGMRAAAGMNKLGWHWWPGTNAIPSWPFKHMAQCVRWGVCERGCPAGAKASFDLGYWPHATKAGAELITGARVAKITVDGDGLADGAIWLDRDGGEHRVAARAVMLAANGVGTPRLLLMSDDHDPAGLANSSGLVGKNLMLHPNAAITGIYDEPLESWNGPAGQLIYSLEFYETDPDRGFPRGAKWNLMPIPGVLSVLECFADLPFDQRWGPAVHRLSRHAGSVINWVANVEDLPEESNRVTLDPELRDGSGLPAPAITYRMSDQTKANVRFSLDRMKEAHEAAGAAKTFEVPLWVDAPGHLLGTARMGDDPETSVVDSFGRSHDVPNLFVIDGSVMVTSGAMNPTATIAALALRTATHLAATAREMQVPA